MEHHTHKKTLKEWKLGAFVETCFKVTSGSFKNGHVSHLGCVHIEKAFKNVLSNL